MMRLEKTPMIKPTPNSFVIANTLSSSLAGQTVRVELELENQLAKLA